MKSALDNAHVQAVLNEIAAVSPAYQGDDQQHLWELMDFAHAAYFHKANAGGAVSFDPNAVKASAQAAFDAFAASQHLDDVNPTASSILYDWVTAVDAAMLADRYSTQLVGILHTFNTDANRWSDYGQGIVTYSTLLAVRRQVGLDPAFAAKVDQSLIDELSSLAQHTNLPQVNAYLPSNAIYVLGGICGNVPNFKAAAVQAITKARAVWPKFSPEWLWTVTELDECNGCLDANGAKLCKSDVQGQLLAQQFPSTYAFEDGALVVHAAGSIPLDTIQRLYHAVKQVEAQFNRLTQTIAPLEDDPNGVLKVYLFGTPDDYHNYAPFLFGLGTSNGGIYIEQDGTFYTYDRTPQQSPYPFDELVRHEFTHYLAGRFLIEGMWGTAPLYQAGRMTWFDEGLAEFCTWSTIDEGIKPRRRLVDMVRQDGNDRMTVSQVVNTGPGNFKYYRYAALLFSYWYEHDLATLLGLVDLVRNATDAQSAQLYEQRLDQLAADQGLQAAYDQYLADLVAGLGQLDDPSTVVPPLDSLDLAAPADIQARVRQTRVGYLADVAIAAENIDARFSARGALSGQIGMNQDVAAAWRAFDADLDELIDALEQQGVNNFTALNGRFGRIRWVDEGGGTSYPMADYFVEGPIAHDGNQLLPPQQQVEADFHSTRLGVNAQATLVNQSTVGVSLSLTTGLHSNATPDAVLAAELEDERAELRNQVYAIRPPYYRAFTVAWDGAAQTIPDGNEKYGLRNVVCTVTLA